MQRGEREDRKENVCSFHMCLLNLNKQTATVNREELWSVPCSLYLLCLEEVEEAEPRWCSR